MEEGRGATESLLDHAIFQGMVAHNSHTSEWREQFGSVMEEIPQRIEFVIDGNAERLEDLGEATRRSPSIHLFDDGFKLQSCFGMRSTDFLRQMMALWKFSVHFEYVCKFFFSYVAKESGCGNSLRSIKAEVERRIVAEGEPTIRIIDVGRTEAKIGEEDVDIRESQQADRAKIFMNEVDVPPPLCEVSCGHCEVFLVSIDADEPAVLSDVLEEGAGMAAESHGGVEDGLPCFGSEDADDFLLENGDMMWWRIWLYILILSRF